MSARPRKTIGETQNGVRPGVDDRSLREIVDRLVKAYEPESVYLFGSRARGGQDVHSDYDLLLVVADDAPPERRRGRLAYQALASITTAADVVVWTRQAFDARLHLKASLPSTAVREGRLLYGA